MRRGKWPFSDLFGWSVVDHIVPKKKEFVFCQNIPNLFCVFLFAHAIITMCLASSCLPFCSFPMCFAVLFPPLLSRHVLPCPSGTRRRDTPPGQGWIEILAQDDCGRPCDHAVCVPEVQVVRVLCRDSVPRQSAGHSSCATEGRFHSCSPWTRLLTRLCTTVAHRQSSCVHR